MVNIVYKDQIVKFFKNNNCFLLSKYQNSRIKLNYICKCGNYNSQTWTQFKNTIGCKDCSKNKQIKEKDVDVYKKICNVYGRLIIRILTPELTSLMVESILGYTKEDLYHHIKSFEKFDFKQDWVIDHILPVKAFTDHGIMGLAYGHIINSLENLQPLEKYKNNEKGSNYNLEEFYEYLKKHNLEPIVYPSYVLNQNK